MARPDPMQLSEPDRQIIREQLGREPRGAMGVAVRCPAGHPLVVQVYPLLREGPDAIPFPTTFWLSCPVVVTKISRIEADGWIGRLQDMLQEDPVWRAEQEADHRRSAAERWDLLRAEDRAWVEQRGWDGLRESGIGGIHHAAHVKCLHLHYADHLARSNSVGRWLAEHFDLKGCP